MAKGAKAKISIYIQQQEEEEAEAGARRGRRQQRNWNCDWDCLLSAACCLPEWLNRGHHAAQCSLSLSLSLPLSLCCFARTLQCEILHTVTHQGSQYPMPTANWTPCCGDTQMPDETRLWLCHVARPQIATASDPPCTPPLRSPPSFPLPLHSFLLALLRTGDHFTNSPGYLPRKIINFLFCFATVLLPSLLLPL